MASDINGTLGAVDGGSIQEYCDLGKKRLRENQFFFGSSFAIICFIKFVNMILNNI